MQTNKRIAADSALAEKGRALIKAAYEYWEEYQKESEPNAVVWVLADDGHFVLFTRGEYRDSIMDAAYRHTRGAEAMFEPFLAIPKRA